MSNLIIRPARPADYPQAAAIMQQVHALHVGWRPDIYQPCEPALTEPDFLEEVAGETCIVAELDGEVVGILSYMRRHVGNAHQVTRNVLFIDVMAVDEQHRHCGIGRQMFDFIREYAREKSFDGVELQVNARNTAAYEMYKHCGFTEKSINMELL